MGRTEPHMEVQESPRHLELLAQAQRGERGAREELIRQFKPFILRVLSQRSGRFVQQGQDEEISIGLMAFDEAINSYDPQKSGSFLAFAETVIKRRLIDYYRKEQRGNKVIPLSGLGQEEEDGLVVAERMTMHQAMLQHQLEQERLERREEIVAYSKLLARFQISFRELPEICPKHADARANALAAARLVAERPELRQHLLNRGELPLKELTELVEVSRKTLERQRKYIIAIALILIYDFSYLKEYVQ